MGVETIVGVRLLHSRVRLRRRSFYFWDQGPSGRPGGTLLYVIRGKALCRVNGKEFTADKGDVMTWDPGMLEEMRPHPGSRISYCLLTFELYSPEGESINVSRLGLPNVIRPRRTKPLWGLLKAIHDARSGERGYFMEECSMLCLKLFRLLRKTPLLRKRMEAMPAADERIRRTLAFMAEHYKAKHRVKFLARMACMHPVHYNRLFKRLTGVTPCRYFLERKIEKAKDFLTLYGDSPGAVSLEFGFHDYAHFHRTFKRLTGMTPAEYARAPRKR